MTDPLEQQIDAADADESSDEVAVAEEEGLPVWTSDAGLDLEEARLLTSRRGATVAMFLGETGVGKTTLLAELWTDLLLHGALGDLQFGGTATAMAFEERAFQSRMESGVLKAYTLKTYEEDDGFLHLRMGRAAGSLVELLLSDFAGEHFVRIREGTPLTEELTWAPRVDRFAVVVDAKAATTPGEREVAITRSERLLHSLHSAKDEIGPKRLALVMAKDDAVKVEDRSSLVSAIDRLTATARGFDESCAVISVAARPALGTAPYGLDALLQWLCAPDDAVMVEAGVAARPARSFGRFRG